jgi:hypothetical protein
MTDNDEIDLDKYFDKYVCIYEKDMFKIEGIIIYWYPKYQGFRGTVPDFRHNWPQS